MRDSEGNGTPRGGGMGARKGSGPPPAKEVEAPPSPPGVVVPLRREETGLRQSSGPMRGDRDLGVFSVAPAYHRLSLDELFGAGCPEPSRAELADAVLRHGEAVLAGLEEARRLAEGGGMSAPHEVVEFRTSEGPWRGPVARVENFAEVVVSEARPAPAWGGVLAGLDALLRVLGGAALVWLVVGALSSLGVV